MITSANSRPLINPVKSSDPRINSPEIKVVYPSDVSMTKEAESENQSTAPIKHVLPTSTETTVSETPSNVNITPEIKTPVTADTNSDVVKAPTWLDHVKEHTGLFIIVGLLSGGLGLLLGILITKKR